MKLSERRLLARLRLESQRIAPAVGTAGHPLSARDVVHHMTAMQAQDLPGAKWSVGLRAEGSTLADIDAALTDRSIVRSWPFRGTLHFVAAEDLEWMLDLTAARTVKGAAKRYRDAGLDEAQLGLAAELAAGALEGGHRLTRAELFAAFEAGGISTEGTRGTHLIWYLSHIKLLCLGPVQGGQQLIVLLREWVEEPRRPSRDESLRELALRYFTSHGPASLEDYLSWSKLLVPDARLGVELAGDLLETIVVAGRPYLLAADRGSAGPTAAPTVHLLPGFDELLLGYRDRSAVLDEQYSERIVPGGNGMFLPTVVVGGFVVGTWKRRPRGGRMTVVPELFEPTAELSAAHARGLARAARRYADFLGLEVD